MHLPDGVLNGHTEIVVGAVAAGGVAIAARAAREELRAVEPTRVAAVTALVFAFQMVNFPVASGTSGHLIGAALAVALLGPGLGILAAACVVALQALVFADGGLSSLGVNVVNMAVVPGAVAWLLLRRDDHLPTVSLAAMASVLAAAAAFSVEYALGGLGGASPALVARDMLGVHLLIAAGEVGLTTAVVWASRRWALQPGPLLAGSVGVAVVLAPWANPNPDGLERVAIDRGIDSLGRIPDLASPLADYAMTGVTQPQATVALAGAIGTAVVAALAWAVARALEPATR